MAISLSESTKAKIRKSIDDATEDPQKIPGCVLVVVGKDGKPLITHASGKKGIDIETPNTQSLEQSGGGKGLMTMSTTFWIASCTKMICAIAAMQLVEQGKLALDDADMVEKFCPELKTVKILKNISGDGKPELVDKKNGITLRMLLTHTAGFGYTFFDHNLRRYGQPAGHDEFSGFANDIQSLPLTGEPGTKWQYGVGIDWAGNLVERVTGMSLNDYFQKHIFQPLGIQNISMFPNSEMKSRLAHMHQKDSSGVMHGRDHLLRRPLVADEKEIPNLYNSAGAGCFAPPLEYCEILATLLNDGLSPTTGNRILKPETVKEMFTNQIPQIPNFGRQGIPAAKPDLTNPIPDLYPQPAEQEQGWGLSFMLTIHPGSTGRGANTAWWAGGANLFWWCDREKGIAGMIATQILPFASKLDRDMNCRCADMMGLTIKADTDVLGLWFGVEQAIYAGMEGAGQEKTG